MPAEYVHILFSRTYVHTHIHTYLHTNMQEEVRRSTATQLAAKNENAGSLQDHEDPIDLDIDLEYGEVETLLSGGERSGDTNSKPAEVKKGVVLTLVRCFSFCA